MKNIRQIALTSYYPYGKNKDKIIAKRIFDVDEALAEHDKQVRADAIEECINSLGMVLDNENIKSELRHLFEQLKEQNNE